MPKKKVQFASAAVDFYFNSKFSDLRTIVDQKQSVLLTDEHVFASHEKKFRNWNTIVLKAGEAYKVQATVDTVIEQLIEMGADRNSTLVGIGGGVVTDLTGYIASVYMRGIRFGFVPTTLLCLVDASIGGKNGIDVGPFKNMAGTIRQPSFILHDLGFLNSLPDHEWRNGFAEIIKHACIKDAGLFGVLEKNTLQVYQKKKDLLSALIQKNALIKIKVVQNDEFEKGDRKLLNFGHTLGHALETQYELSHGQAISIGMGYASLISKQLVGFKGTEKVVALLERYGLPVFAEFDKDKVISILKMDKKKEKESIHFILLERIGKAVIRQIPVQQIHATL